MYVPETVHDGFIIQKRVKNLDIAGSLDFIRDREYPLYMVLKACVKKIQYSPYFYTRSYPFYDEINVSEFSLERGNAHAASVIIHELIHVMFQKIRNDKGIRESLIGDFIAGKGLDYGGLVRMSSREEEAFAYRAQLAFLDRHGSERDRLYQRLRMEKLGIQHD